jgi:hypothetical protein
VTLDQKEKVSTLKVELPSAEGAREGQAPATHGNS